MPHQSCQLELLTPSPASAAPVKHSTSPITHANLGPNCVELGIDSLCATCYSVHTTQEGNDEMATATCHKMTTSAEPQATPLDAGELDAMWVMALDRSSFAACHALLRHGYTPSPNLAHFRDLTPAGQAAYDRLTAELASDTM